MEIGSNVDNLSNSSSSLQDIGLEENRPKGRNNTDDDVQHDQLPTVDEYKASGGVGKSSTTTTSLLKARLTMGIMIMIGCIMIMTGIAVGNRKNAARAADGGGAHGYHAQLSARGQEIATFVVNMGWATLESTKNKFSPQSKAIYWLADEDPMLGLEINDNEFMQRYLLATIYYALSGPNWSVPTNFLTEKKSCEWNNLIKSVSNADIEVGVSCRGDELIKSIFLPRMAIHGSLPEEIGHLPSLEDLNLFQNKILGSIPDSWQNLLHLKNLILHDNMIGGSLPPWISSLPLQTLNLAENRFTGSVPDFTGFERHIEIISLEHNAFTGDLTFLSGLHGVTSIYLGNNQFSGSLSNQFLSHFRDLEIFDVSDNLLTGDLPAALLAMDTLVVADLHGNKLSGKLPDFVEFGSPMRFLALQGNGIHGTIDGRLSVLSNLEHLDLSSNFFSGTMPTQLGSLSDLRYLYLAFNVNFEPGSIPASYARLSQLKDLSLQSTNRTGEIPFMLLDDYELEMLDLNDNRLSGTIPEELGRLAKLKFMLLKNNQLTGTIPTQLGRLTNLNTLLLDDNKLTSGTTTICQKLWPSGFLKTFIADCDELTDECECCSTCCRDAETSCNDVVWFSDLDPIAEGNYERSQYVFKDADVVYDLPETNTIPSFYKNFSGYSFTDEDYTGLPP
jgi:Leucine-rich repeat (LRR) protein